MLVSRREGKVRTTVKKRQDCIDHEEDNKYVVNVKSLLLLLLLRSIEVVELVTLLMFDYALKC